MPGSLDCGGYPSLSPRHSTRLLGAKGGQYEPGLCAAVVGHGADHISDLRVRTLLSAIASSTASPRGAECGTRPSGSLYADAATVAAGPCRAGSSGGCDSKL